VVSYHPSLSRPLSIPSLLLTTLLLPTPHPAQVSSGTLNTSRNTLARTLDASRNTTRTALHAVRSALSVSAQRSRTLDRVAVLVLAAALGAVDAFLREGVADGLCEAAFADLARDEAVYAVLEVVDLVDAGDFGLVEVFCCVGRLAGV